MEFSREQEALQAYLKLLSVKGVSKRVLVQREFILLRLSMFLNGIPCDGMHYRHAVDKFVNSIDQAEIIAVLPVIREFFSFWVKDIKAIAAMSQAQVFSGNLTMGTASQDELFKHWYDLDKNRLTPAEQEIMAQFNESGHANGSESGLAKERLRMAKFLLVSLRTVNFKQSYSYRQVVDRNLPLFDALGSRHTYLSVAREFYYFWRGEISSQGMRDKQKLTGVAIAA